MLNWLRRRRLSPDAQKKLLLLRARAEESLIETHVDNIYDLFETLGDEIDLDHGLSLYAQMMGLGETYATTVANRLLARLEGHESRARRGRRRNVFRDED